MMTISVYSNQGKHNLQRKVDLVSNNTKGSCSHSMSVSGLIVIIGAFTGPSCSEKQLFIASSNHDRVFLCGFSRRLAHIKEHVFGSCLINTPTTTNVHANKSRVLCRHCPDFSLLLLAADNYYPCDANVLGAREAAC
jgi:hypothetical protein